MRTIYLPYALSNTIKALSYIFVAILDIIHLLLAPITWIKFKAHLVMFAAAGVMFLYMHFFKAIDNAGFIVGVSLASLIIAVVLIKFLRVGLHKVRQFLMKLFYSPLGVCIRI